MRHSLKPLALALALPFVMGSALGGCSHVALTQDPGTARILAGSLDEPARQLVPAERVAPLFVQYAWLSAKAYDDRLYGLATGHRAGVEMCDADENCSMVNRNIAQLQAIWGKEPVVSAINDCSEEAGTKARRDFGHDGKSGKCGVDDPARDRVLDGLGIQIWARGRGCEELVVAFRGTDAHQSDDWLSNLRWITRVLPLYDQYEQAREHVDRLINMAAARLGCTPKRITAVGHSLGGGLAQHAAYAQQWQMKSPARRAGITRVYAFDPSFVTGFYDKDIDPVSRDRVVRGLKIERVYEHGEILAYPRFVLRHLYPPSACDPQVRLVRFNLLEGNITAQHNMARLVRKMMARTASPLARTPMNEAGILPPAPEARGETGECLPPAAHASLNSAGTEAATDPAVITIVRFR